MADRQTCATALRDSSIRSWPRRHACLVGHTTEVVERGIRGRPLEKRSLATAASYPYHRHTRSLRRLSPGDGSERMELEKMQRLDAARDPTGEIRTTHAKWKPYAEPSCDPADADPANHHGPPATNEIVEAAGAHVPSGPPNGRVGARMFLRRPTTTRAATATHRTPGGHQPSGCGRPLSTANVRRPPPSRRRS